MVRRKRRPFVAHRAQDSWVIPYADLLTLLLALFIVLYSISSVNENKYRVIARALTTAFGGKNEPALLMKATEHHKNPFVSSYPLFPDKPTHRPWPPISASSSTPSADQTNHSPPPLQESPRTHPFSDLAQQLNQTLAPLLNKHLMSIHQHPYAVEIDINSDILFTTGSATLNASAHQTLAEIANVLRSTQFFVHVAGYTDNQPISTARFLSNWELSVARAANVVHLFADEGIAPDHLAIIGYGEFRPRADNSTEQGRRANRRVTIVVTPEALNAFGSSTSPQPPSVQGNLQLPPSD